MENMTLSELTSLLTQKQEQFIDSMTIYNKRKTEFNYLSNLDVNINYKAQQEAKTLLADSESLLGVLRKEIDKIKLAIEFKTKSEEKEAKDIKDKEAVVRQEKQDTVIELDLISKRRSVKYFYPLMIFSFVTGGFSIINNYVTQKESKSKLQELETEITKMKSVISNLHQSQKQDSIHKAIILNPSQKQK
jgi:hypothetical protein